MGDYFKPWRRKFGVLTLVMACALALGWARSQFRLEFIDVSFGIVTYGVASMHGGLDFYRTTALNSTTVSNFIDYKSVDLFIKRQDPFNGTPWTESFEFEWRWDWAGFHLGEGRYANRRDQDCMIPYLSILMPLTLLSAWLLLGPPESDPTPRRPRSDTLYSPTTRLFGQLLRLSGSTSFWQSLLKTYILWSTSFFDTKSANCFTTAKGVDIVRPSLRMALLARELIAAGNSRLSGLSVMTRLFFGPSCSVERQPDGSGCR